LHQQVLQSAAAVNPDLARDNVLYRKEGSSHFGRHVVVRQGLGDPKRRDPWESILGAPL
jgi:hypothetical protein